MPEVDDEPVALPGVQSCSVPPLAPDDYVEISFAGRVGPETRRPRPLYPPDLERGPLQNRRGWPEAQSRSTRWGRRLAGSFKSCLVAGGFLRGQTLQGIHEHRPRQVFLATGSHGRIVSKRDRNSSPSLFSQERWRYRNSVEMKFVLVQFGLGDQLHRALRGQTSF